MKRTYLGDLNWGWGSLCGGLSCRLGSRGLGGLAEMDSSMQISFNGEKKKHTFPSQVQLEPPQREAQRRQEPPQLEPQREQLLRQQVPQVQERPKENITQRSMLRRN